jgi:glycosyltransferase 2 family protein
MNRKQLLIYAVLAAVLALMAYLQVRAWKTFDWGILGNQLSHLNWWRLSGGVALIYADYFLRGLRWKIMLRPVKQTSALRMAPAQFIGFAALAILGRPGDFLRPYLIAKKEGLTVTSQLAVWTVERIFDMASFAAILIASLAIFRDELSALPYFGAFINNGGRFLFSVVLGMAAFALVMRFRGRKFAAWLEARFGGFAPRPTRIVTHKIISFSDGLNTVSSPWCFLQLCLISMLIWVVIAIAYLLVIYSYPDPDLRMPVSYVMLLMGFSVIGGVAQLPMVGGGSMVATLFAFERVFIVGHETSVGCSLLLWLVTFMAVIPAGLALARREHISIMKVAAEEEKELAALP